jgi:geranylgeranyl pyrophosphate synthase
VTDTIAESSVDIAARVAAWRDRFEDVLDRHLPAGDSAPKSLHQAMRYAALAGGKRFRPILVYAAGEALCIEPERLDPIALAIELIHAYSLVHDDLPAMDDDDLRRGQPTCHRAFGEATAILAGDALQALAFEVLAAGLQGEPNGLAVIHEIAHACGSGGMAGGQALDLAAVGQSLDREGLEEMHRLKTGALIRAAVVAPCLLEEGAGGACRQLGGYGECIGLAFQVRDDILDVTGDSAVTGKSTLADSALDKPTFVSILGLEESRDQAGNLRDQALSALEHVKGDTAVLAWLAAYVVRRDR